VVGAESGRASDGRYEANQPNARSKISIARRRRISLISSFIFFLFYWAFLPVGTSEPLTGSFRTKTKNSLAGFRLFFEKCSKIKNEPCLTFDKFATKLDCFEFRQT